MGTSSKRSNLAQIVLAAFIAFAVGALVVWVILSSHRQNPQHENSLFNLAALYLQTAHEPAKAIELLEDFRKRFPKSGALPRVQELLDEAKTEK
ncbi:MAG: hypothetical protein WB586_23220 [Chthoniobacterales bacterium]